MTSSPLFERYTPRAVAIPGTFDAELHDVLARMNGVALSAIEASLLDRYEIKYLVPTKVIPTLLEYAASYYGVLEIAGRRQADYRTEYFDTSGYSFYLAQHADARPRQKIRIRTYLDAGERYLEWKRKNNRGRTFKLRQRLTSESPDLAAALSEAPEIDLSYVGARDLRPALNVDYTRITLARDSLERVSLDLSIRFSIDNRCATFPDLAIVEIKRDAQGHTPMTSILKGLRFRSMRVSKYSLGIVLLVESVKKNHFKALLRTIERLAGPPVYSLPTPNA